MSSVFCPHSLSQYAKMVIPGATQTLPSLLIWIFKYLYDLICHSMELPTHADVHGYNTRYKAMICLPLSKSSWGKQRLWYHAVKDWAGRIQPTNLTVSQPTNLTVSPEVGPHPNTNNNTNRQNSFFTRRKIWPCSKQCWPPPGSTPARTIKMKKLKVKPRLRFLNEEREKFYAIFRF